MPRTIAIGIPLLHDYHTSETILKIDLGEILYFGTIRADKRLSIKNIQNMIL